MKQDTDENRKEWQRKQDIHYASALRKLADTFEDLANPEWHKTYSTLSAYIDIATAYKLNKFSKATNDPGMMQNYRLQHNPKCDVIDTTHALYELHYDYNTNGVILEWVELSEAYYALPYGVSMFENRKMSAETRDLYDAMVDHWFKGKK